MRVLGIDIIDVSANFSVIIGLDDCFLCHIICYFISGDHSLVFFFLKSSSLRKYFLFCSSSVCFFSFSILFMQLLELICRFTSVWSPVFVYSTKGYLQLGKKALFLFIIIWYQIAAYIVL